MLDSSYGAFIYTNSVGSAWVGGWVWYGSREIFLYNFSSLVIRSMRFFFALFPSCGVRITFS